MVIDLHINEVNFVLQALGNLPTLSGAYPLLLKIKEQAEAQAQREHEQSNPSTDS